VAAKYPFSTEELLRSILNLKCAIGTEAGKACVDLKNGKSVEKRELRILNMNSVLHALELYNPFYYSDPSINCLTIDEMGVLMQKAKQYSGECGCNSPTRPVTIPTFFY